MIASPREIVCRDFNKLEKLFLNYESQHAVELGDIFLWNGRKAEFHRVTRLTNLGITPNIQSSKVKSTRLFNSANGVKMEFSASGRTGQPTMAFRYKGSSKYSLQAYDTTIDSLDEVRLAADITEALESNEFTWEKDWIVVTTIWNADAYTQLVAGGKNAEADVCATATSVNTSFNIADVSIGVNLGYGNELSSQEVAGRGACPFFIGMKYRQTGKIPYMVRYAS